MKSLTIILLAAGFLGTSPLLAADAKTNWEKHCQKCHGADGKGQTTMGKKLKAKDYTLAAEQKKFTDEDAVKIITEGKKEGDKTVKKGFKDTLSEQEIKDLVGHVRKFGK
jgi:mono/diheme cytochrome c family protein